MTAPTEPRAALEAAGDSVGAVTPTNGVEAQASVAARGEPNVLMFGSAAGTPALPTSASSAAPAVEDALARSLPPFPTSAWRGVFAEYRHLIAPTTEAAPALLFGAFAAGLSFLVGRTVTLAAGTGSMIPVLHAVLLGLSGFGRKSTAMDDMQTVIEPLIPLPSQEGEPPSAEIVNGLGSGEGYAEALADRKWKPTDAGDDEPYEVMTGRKALFMVNEVGALLQKADRGQAGAMEDFLLAAFDARPSWTLRTRSSRDSKPLTLTDSVAVVLGASTYAWLAQNLTTTQIMAGLLNRWLLFAGAPSQLLPIRPAIPHERIEAFRSHLASVLKSVRGFPATLTPSANGVHADAYYALRRETTGSEIGDTAIARSDQQALRLALLFAVADQTVVISGDHMTAAWDVVRFSQQVALGLVSRVQVRTQQEVEGRIWGACERVAALAADGHFTKRDVFQRVKGKHGLDVDTFNRFFDAFVKSGVLMSMGGKPPAFVLARRLIPDSQPDAGGGHGGWGTSPDRPRPS